MQTDVPGTTTAGRPSGPRAGFFRRFVAVIVDAIVLGIPYGIVYAAAGETTAALVGLVLGIVYYSYLEGSASGQTVGKKLLGIRVIDFRTGGPLGFGRGFVRYLGRILSGIPCFLGYLWMLWDGEKQTWHDKLATAVVVPESAYPVERWPG